MIHFKLAESGATGITMIHYFLNPGMPVEQI